MGYSWSLERRRESEELRRVGGRVGCRVFAGLSCRGFGFRVMGRCFGVVG